VDDAFFVGGLQAFATLGGDGKKIRPSKWGG